MESDTKVMTVSYGTFACTLEGFDDPFTTMQLVAEYFRKLAADDRYFGGEPLQPDANKLHQIARDVNPNKVDAEISENSVILRQANIVDVPVREAARSQKPAAPEFASKRTALVAKEARTKRVPAPEDASFVESTMFTSRRSALVPAASEPKVSTAELLREVERARSADTTAQDVQRAVKEVAAKIVSPVARAPEATDISPAKEVARIARDLVEKPAAITGKTALRQDQSRKQKRNDQIQREDDALERLLETTNSKLSAPSHARRSNALERLKAAVAATGAERRLRGGAKTSRPKLQELSGEPDTFRQQMKSVRTAHETEMKITRPVLKHSTKIRRRSNIATLVLGTDQRVEAENGNPTPFPKKKRVMGR